MSFFYKDFIEKKSLQIESDGDTLPFDFLLKEFSKLESLITSEQVTSGSFIFYKAKNSHIHILLFLLCEKHNLVFVPMFEASTQHEDDSLFSQLQGGYQVIFENSECRLHKKSAASFRKVLDSGCLFQTSGTTGPAGLVLQSFSNIYKNAVVASEGQSINAQSIILSLLTFSHVGGLCMQTTAAVRQGACIKIVDRYDVQKFSDELKTSSHSIIVPSYLTMLSSNKHFGGQTFDNFPLIVTGSTFVTPGLFDKLQNKGFNVQAVYGLTEVGPYVCYQSSNIETVEGAVSSIGTPVPGYKISLSTDSEILISGPCIGQIWNAAKQEFNSLANEGQLATGDLGLSVNGNYYFTGRKKLMISVGGHKVNPFEVEAVIQLIPEVKKCLVVGKPHRQLGEIPVAYIVAPELIKKKIVEHLKEFLSNYKVPRQFIFVNEIPETRIGKNRSEPMKAQA